MADEEVKRTFENEEKHSIVEDSNVSEQKEPKLKKATTKLKAEALRRFKLKEANKKEDDLKVFLIIFVRDALTKSFAANCLQLALCN